MNGQLLYEGVVIAILLILVAWGKSWITLATATLLLAVGFVFFPKSRARGALAAIVGCIIAATIIIAIK